MNAVRRFLGSEAGEGGQSIVEFALILPIILLIITGVFDVARAVWQENTLAYAAREGTRYAIVHGSGYPDQTQIAWPGNTAGITNVVRNASIGIGTTITVTSTWPDGCYDRSCRVAVDATASFVPLPSQYMLGSAFQITLRGGSELVIQR
ncbi:MAG TPA: TadE family protein [Candidatus Limnocylindria bacterium]|nr:TadE family protein [Candidatus Limnocylindria bacterium]